MTEGEFPNRDFTMRSEGYDRGEVDSYVEDLQGEIVEMRRALETATMSSTGSSDARLHDPEGAVTRTLAIAQETADRVLHDAQIEADQRRAEAEEHATTVIADADERAARLLADMEAQAAEVREQGVAAARSAIQVERDKAMAELAHVRRVRDDLRTEASELKASLDRYRSQAREASDTLAAAASGPLMSLDLPDFIDDDVVLAGIAAPGEDGDFEGSIEGKGIDFTVDPDADPDADPNADSDEGDSHLRSVEDVGQDLDPALDEELAEVDPALADVISIGSDEDIDTEVQLDTGEDSEEGDGFGGTFLAEVRAAADDDDVALPEEGESSDRFLSELRGLSDDPDTDPDIDTDAADRFFDSE